MQFVQRSKQTDKNPSGRQLKKNKENKAEDLIVSPSCVQCPVKRSAIAELKIFVQNLHNDE